jgi:hypothetical protein
VCVWGGGEQFLKDFEIERERTPVWASSGLMVAIMTVLQLPPRLRQHAEGRDGAVGFAHERVGWDVN